MRLTPRVTLDPVAKRKGRNVDPVVLRYGSRVRVVRRLRIYDVITGLPMPDGEAVEKGWAGRISSHFTDRGGKRDVQFDNGQSYGIPVRWLQLENDQAHFSEVSDSERRIK